MRRKIIAYGHYYKEFLATLTEKEIQIVMNALNGTPTLTTSKFADKIETILRKYKENKDE